jgi:polypeptide N-acetylgalactosaminyltransferase
VKLVRTPSRLGLIRARLFGAQVSRGVFGLAEMGCVCFTCDSGNILVFLDSHIEANVGWLAALLDPIRQDRRTVVAPIIDNIDKNTMSYSGHRSPGESVGIFNWGLEFKWGPSRNRPKDLSEPFEFVDNCCVLLFTLCRAPTMAGGLFAIDKSYFYELGSYDEAMVCRFCGTKQVADVC